MPRLLVRLTVVAPLVQTANYLPASGQQIYAGLDILWLGARIATVERANLYTPNLRQIVPICSRGQQNLLVPYLYPRWSVNLFKVTFSIMLERFNPLTSELYRSVQRCNWYIVCVCVLCRLVASRVTTMLAVQNIPIVVYTCTSPPDDEQIGARNMLKVKVPRSKPEGPEGTHFC
jgi:hypothetical protein